MHRSFFSQMYSFKFFVNKILRVLSFIIFILLIETMNIVDIHIPITKAFIIIFTTIFSFILFFSNKRTISILTIIVMFLKFSKINSQFDIDFYINIVFLTNIVYLWATTIFFTKIKYRFLGKTI